MKLTLLAFILLLSCSVLGQSNPCQTKVNAGDFWFGFMEAPESPNHGTMIRSFGAFSLTYSIDNKITFAKENIGTAYITGVTSLSGSEVIQKTGNHVVTDHPAAVFAQLNSDATQIIPTANLGNEYYVMCYTPRSITEFLIVATQDNTQVEITPSVNTAGGQLSNQTLPIKLNQGEVYQVQSANLPGLPGQGDLTGSYIKSNTRIAVFSGSYESALPSSPNSYNHFFEEMIPVQSWGTRFVALPFQKGKEDLFRVMASLPQTTIKIAGNTYVLNNPGEYRDIPLSDPAMIECSNPVLVAQYSSGTAPNGKPFMVLVKSVNQTTNKSIAYDFPTSVNLIVRTDAVNFIKVKNIWGKALSVNYQVIPGTEFSYSQINESAIANSAYSIETTIPGKGFIAYEFQSGAESYGLSYNDIESKEIVLDLGGIKYNQGRKVLTLCDGEGPKTLDAGSDFTTYKWSTGASTRTIEVSSEGLYTVEATATGGCVLRDTVKVVISKSFINLGPDTLLCDSPSLVLKTGDTFADYKWTTPEGILTTPAVTASRSGKYSVEAITREGCRVKDTISLTFGPPKIKAPDLDTLICGKKSTVLNISADRGNYSLERLSDGFTFNERTVSVPDWGTWTFKFTAVDATGCSADTSFKIGFVKLPTVDFSIDSTKCYHYNLEVKYLGDAESNASRFTWIFGGDTLVDGTALDNRTIPLGINKNKRDLVLKVVHDGCSNADTIKDIKVIPNLDLTVKDSLGCEPFKAEFIAHNTETVTYDWNFGDGSSERSGDQVIHNYMLPGFYDVGLKVTTPRGCFNNVHIDSMVQVAPIPTMGFSLDAAKCLNPGDHQVSYVGSGTQKDSYGWDLSGFDPEEIIQNPGLSQGPFIFNLKNKPQTVIGLQVTSQYGCKSEKGIAVVKRVPYFSMEVADSTGCVPLETKFEGINKDKVDQVSYSWDFGDGTTGTGEKITHIYKDADGKYTVTLQALSAITGCMDTLKKIDLVQPYPNPKADFTMDHPIVYNDKPDVKFENLSTGAVNYLWDFGDGSTSTEANVLHKYKVMGYQKVLLQSFSEFMCSDTISHTVLVGNGPDISPQCLFTQCTQPG